MLNRETAINKIRAFVNVCRNKKITFSKVILFGSCVSNANREYSDIDVALFSDCFSGKPFADWHLLSQINIKFTDIDPHPYPSDYYKNSDPYIDEIKKTGIEIII